MTQDDLAQMPASVALDMFRKREVSPVEVTAALIARAEATAGDVNAFTFTYFEEALTAARHAEDRYMGRGEPRARSKGCVLRSRIQAISPASPPPPDH